MFSLYEKEKDEIEFNGNTYSINASFDNILSIIDLMNEKSINDAQKLNIGLKMLFGKETILVKLPVEEQLNIFNIVFENYITRETKTKQIKYDRQGNELPEFKEDRERNYSLKYDADFIYASFMQAYNIDLIEQQGKLHWFKFRALLSGLPEDTKFRQVISIRMWKKNSQSKNAEEEQMKKLKKIYALPDEEREVDDG